MFFFHDSRSEEYRTPFGAAPCGSRVRLRVRAQGLTSVTLRIWWANAEYKWFMRRAENDLFEYEMQIPEETGLLWYFFMGVDSDGQTWYLGNAEDGLGGVGCCSRHEPPSFQITVYDPAYRTPEWMRNGVMYQIMMDRFNNAGGTDVKNLPAGSYYHAHWSDDPALVINDRQGNNSANDFFGGNLKGVEEKLDYIQSLGVSALYFNPIFRAHSNHKYDTGDYMQIDPSFGSEADFKSLCTAAKKRGMRIVIDGVFSHTGSDSRYFNRYGTYGEDTGAARDPKSPFRSWYSFSCWPNEYSSWWGFNTLPNVDENDPTYRQFIINGEDSVVAHWTKAGAGGWRLDVADELPMDFIRALRKREKGIDPDACLIGEVWEDPSNKVAYGETRCYCAGETLDATMNYPLRETVISFMLCHANAHDVVRQIDAMRETQPKQFYYSQMNLLGSHDRPRIISMLADIGNMEPDRKYRYPIEMAPDKYELGRRRFIAAWNLVCFLPGMPCMYYADEAGLYGMSDPYCRGTYPWGSEDKALIEACRESAQRRRKSAALRTGDVKLSAYGEDVLLVERFIKGSRDVFGKSAKNETRALAVNRADESRWMEYEGKTVEIPAQRAVVLK